MSMFQSDMNNEFKRYATFSGFRSPDGVWPLQLARAGFYRSGACEEFQVVCFACGLVLDLRDVSRHPVMEIHCRLKPDCSFVSGSSNNQPVPPTDHGAAVEWLRQNFSFDTLRDADSTQQSYCLPYSQASNEAESVPNEPILLDNFTLSDIRDIASNLPNLSDLNTLELDFEQSSLPSLPMDFLDGFASATLDSVPTAQLFQNESYSPSQRQFGSSLGGPGEILVTDGVSAGEEGSYPAPSMPDSEISNYSSMTQQPAQVGELGANGVLKKLTFDDLGIIIQRPKRPEFSLLPKRLDTFKAWFGPEIFQSKERIAEAGFYYAGYADCCRCFYCGGGLKNWERDDDPWVEHARWFKNCPFVLTCKGKEFIQAVDSLARTSTNVSGVLLSDVENEMRRIKSTGSPDLDDAENWQREAEMDTQADEDENMESEAARLTDENLSLLQPELCKICLDSEVSIVYVPCGHLVACGTCASTVKICPVCRETIGGQIRIQRGGD